MKEELLSQIGILSIMHIKWRRHFNKKKLNASILCLQQSFSNLKKKITFLQHTRRNIQPNISYPGQLFFI